MPVTGPELTTFMKFPYPGEESNPFWDQWVEMMRVIDQAAFMARIQSNLFVSGGGTRSWNGTTGVFSWTDDFVIPVYFWGKRVLVRYGSDNANRTVTLADGEALAIELPASMNADVVVNFKKITQLPQSVDSVNNWVVAWRYSNVLQIKTVGELV